MKTRTRMKAQSNRFYCTACLCVFTVEAIEMKRARPFCPSCGESADVRLYRPDTDRLTPAVKPQKSWTVPEERRLLNFLRETPLTYREIGEAMRRSGESVRKRVEQWRDWAPRHGVDFSGGVKAWRAQHMTPQRGQGRTDHAASH